MFLGKFGREWENRGLVKFVIFRKSCCAQLYSSFEMKMRKFLQETESPKGRLSNLS